eukprot:1157407-Pelagomonas_calceolata.AAC.2
MPTKIDLKRLEPKADGKAIELAVLSHWQGVCSERPGENQLELHELPSFGLAFSEVLPCLCTRVIGKFPIQRLKYNKPIGEPKGQTRKRATFAPAPGSVSNSCHLQAMTFANPFPLFEDTALFLETQPTTGLPIGPAQQLATAS